MQENTTVAVDPSSKISQEVLRMHEVLIKRMNEVVERFHSINSNAGGGTGGSPENPKSDRPVRPGIFGTYESLLNSMEDRMADLENIASDLDSII